MDWLDQIIEILKYVFLWPILLDSVSANMSEFMVIVLQVVWILLILAILNLLFSGGSSLFGRRR
jgi:hypothetical protein